MEIYEEILRKPLTFPQSLQDDDAQILMEQLLEKLPQTRALNSFEAIKASPWFEIIDWDKLYRKELEAPFIPMVD